MVCINRGKTLSFSNLRGWVVETSEFFSWGYHTNIHILHSVCHHHYYLAIFVSNFVFDIVAACPAFPSDFCQNGGYFNDECQCVCMAGWSGTQCSICEYSLSGVEVCQMLSWRSKNGPHSNNIWDTVTNLVPLHSVHQAPSYEPILTLLAPFLTEFAYLSMLFILEVLCAEHLKNK